MKSSNLSTSTAATTGSRDTVVQGKSMKYPMGLCHGCGHSGHIRKYCPHKECVGYMGSGFCNRPIDITKRVAVIYGDNQGCSNDVTEVNALLFRNLTELELLGNGPQIVVGLDSMSSVTCISNDIVERLWLEKSIVITENISYRVAGCDDILSVWEYTTIYIKFSDVRNPVTIKG